jgi:CDP-diacylglycerol---serine O-phosphatidyltransferase
LQGNFGEMAWVAGFIYLACAAIRLARFNILIGEELSRSYFKGVPSPMAAGVAVVPAMAYMRYVQPGPLTAYFVAVFYLIALVGAGILMVSPIRFRTFKDIHFTKYGVHWPMLAVVLYLAITKLHPQATFLVTLCVYYLWGFIEEIFILRPKEKELRMKRRETRKKRREARKLKKQAARESKMRVVGGGKGE